MPRRNMLYVKLNAGLRHALVYHQVNLQKNIVVTEYPKSGGSWICQMLSASTDIQFPRNRLPIIGKQILHGHYLASHKIAKPIVVLRDGRDIAVSYYFHSLFENDKFNGRLVERTTKRLNFQDPSAVVSNLPKFIEFIFTEKMFPRYTWVDFTEGWLDVGAPYFKYEDFLEKPAETLMSAAQLIDSSALSFTRATNVADQFSFKNMAKRKSGVEDHKSFLRKGISGDWKEKFSSESRQIFDHFAGATLVRCGYESDSSWVDKQTDIQ